MVPVRSNRVPALRCILQDMTPFFRWSGLTSSHLLPPRAGPANKTGRSAERRQRIKRKGRTKQIVKDKLIKAVDDLEAGIETSDGHTVAEAVEDW
jgi:hypothetical protein